MSVLFDFLDEKIYIHCINYYCNYHKAHLNKLFGFFFMRKVYILTKEEKLFGKTKELF